MKYKVTIVMIADDEKLKDYDGAEIIREIQGLGVIPRAQILDAAMMKEQFADAPEMKIFSIQSELFTGELA